MKTFHAGAFASLGINFVPREEFYSVSSKGVLRGMHFQAPPAAQQKLVYCARGRVLDVVMDLRRGSPAYGQTRSFELSAAGAEQLFLPRGLAHGFLALEEDSTMVYLVDAGYSPAHDAGVLWNSFGFAWPEAAPVVSERDRSFPRMEAFASPFEYRREQP